MSGETVLIVNPRSAAGRTGRRLDELEALARSVCGPGVVVAATTRLGQGRELAREAAETGAARILAVGGDGTASEVVDGVLGAPGTHPLLGLVPAGTGSDLAKTLGMPSDWREALAAIVTSPPCTIDALEGTWADPDGQQRTRRGVNVAGIGMAGDVVHRVNQGSKRLGGKVSFLLATLNSLVRWRSPRVALTWWDAHGAERHWEGPLSNVFVGNGRYCGGGMLTGPAASLTDGLLDLVIIPALPVSTMLVLTPALYDGTLARRPELVVDRVTRVRAAALDGDRVPCDLDGEEPGVLPAEIRVLPGALRWCAPGLADG